MRNLSKTVDRILKIEPNLEGHLLPIKSKWDKGPKRISYWRQLFKVLNAEIPREHPKRFEIQNLFNKNKNFIKNPHTFESPSSIETVIGAIPEHLEGRLRRIDRTQIDLAKKLTEAKMTHNENLMLEVTKRSELLEIEQRKAWFDIKNHFNIWNVGTPTSFFIRYKDPLLVLTAIPNNPIAQGPTNNASDPYLVRLDPELLKKLFRFLNNPPPEMPES